MEVFVSTGVESLIGRHSKIENLQKDYEERQLMFQWFARYLYVPDTADTLKERSPKKCATQHSWQ